MHLHKTGNFFEFEKGSSFLPLCHWHFKLQWKWDVGFEPNPFLGTTKLCSRHWVEKHSASMDFVDSWKSSNWTETEETDMHSNVLTCHGCWERKLGCNFVADSWVLHVSKMGCNFLTDSSVLHVSLGEQKPSTKTIIILQCEHTSPKNDLCMWCVNHCKTFRNFWMDILPWHLGQHFWLAKQSASVINVQWDRRHFFVFEKEIKQNFQWGNFVNDKIKLLFCNQAFFQNAKKFRVTIDTRSCLHTKKVQIALTCVFWLQQKEMLRHGQWWMVASPKRKLHLCCIQIFSRWQESFETQSSPTCESNFSEELCHVGHHSCPVFVVSRSLVRMRQVKMVSGWERQQLSVPEVWQQMFFICKFVKRVIVVDRRGKTIPGGVSFVGLHWLTLVHCGSPWLTGSP